jgi:hypothetical protein
MFIKWCSINIFISHNFKLPQNVTALCVVIHQIIWFWICLWCGVGEGTWGLRGSQLYSKIYIYWLKCLQIFHFYCSFFYFDCVNNQRIIPLGYFCLKILYQQGPILCFVECSQLQKLKEQDIPQWLIAHGGLFENVSEIYSNVSQNDVIHTEIWIVRWFCCCSNILECASTNLVSTDFFTPRLYCVACCS